MQKTISAVKARKNLSQVMNEVVLKGDEYIIEQAGKPLVAIIDLEKYNNLQDDQITFFVMVDKMRDKLKGIKSDRIEKIISEAVDASKKAELENKI